MQGIGVTIGCDSLLHIGVWRRSIASQEPFKGSRELEVAWPVTEIKLRVYGPTCLQSTSRPFTNKADSDVKQAVTSRPGYRRLTVIVLRRVIIVGSKARDATMLIVTAWRLMCIICYPYVMYALTSERIYGRQNDCFFVSWNLRRINEFIFRKYFSSSTLH